MFGVLDSAAMGDDQIELLLRVIDQSIRSQGIPQAGGENARINLWLMDGRPPTDGKKTEIIVTKFEFVPSPE